jgi:serine/threonine-protein kinase
MSEVWEAKDGILGRTVAVKVFRRESAGNDDALQRLRLEAKNNAMLNHENIVQLHDYYEDGSTGYIIMELVNGHSLGELLQKNRIMKLENLLPILVQVARALEYAHNKGVIHRDIKPGNILIRADGVAKITDFGVSKAFNQVNMTAKGMVVGTAQYLSPEQAMGDGASGASDLYALGVIAYEASQGKRPFNGKNAVEIALSQVNDKVPPISARTDPEFASIVLDLLEKDPLKREVSGEAVAVRFANVLSRLTTPAQNPPRNPSTTSSLPESARTGSAPKHQLARVRSSPHNARAVRRVSNSGAPKKSVTPAKPMRRKRLDGASKFAMLIILLLLILLVIILFNIFF